MTPEEEYIKMKLIVTMLFAADKDKGGKLYLFHLERVSMALGPDDLQLMTIGLGHDLIEDKGKYVSYSDLRASGFSERVLEGIRCMTKVPGESYEEYKKKVLSNRDSVKCKKKDIGDNSDLRRLRGVEAKDLQRMNNYITFYYELAREERSWTETALRS
jgi:hypothetical protein